MPHSNVEAGNKHLRIDGRKEKESARRRIYTLLTFKHKYDKFDVLVSGKTAGDVVGCATSTNYNSAEMLVPKRECRERNKHKILKYTQSN